MSTVAANRQQRANFSHEVFLYASDVQYVAGMVPFIREGLRLSEPVLVVVDAAKIALLKSALGPEADQVEFAEMSQVGRNPACIIPAWRDFVARNQGRRVRGIGEPVTATRGADEVLECQQHEALLNVAFTNSSSWSLLCPYDVTTLPDEVIAGALRVHPYLAQSGEPRRNPNFEPAVTVEPLDGALPPIPDVALRVEFGSHDLGRIRRFVQAVAREARLGHSKSADLVLAVNEVATNSLRHGGGRGTLTVWNTEDGTVVCEIRDSGWITEPLVGREHPPRDRFGGRGVWLANQLCDLVQLRSSPSGTTIRLHIGPR